MIDSANSSIKNVIPKTADMNKASYFNKLLNINFGVLIGVTGDVKGKMLLTGEKTVFEVIGKDMYGMDLEGDMLTSFSGELGNMIAGGISTKLFDKGIKTDINYPTILEGNTTLIGYQNAIQVIIGLEDIGLIHI